MPPIVLDDRCVRADIMPYRGESAVAFGGKHNMPVGLRTAAHGAEHLWPFQHQFDGALDDLRGHCSEDNMRPRRTFATESTSGERTDDAHVLLRQPDCLRKHLLHSRYVLRGIDENNSV